MSREKNEDFTARVVAAMVHEVAQAEQAARNMRALFEALAKEQGVTVTNAQA